ncbi:MAG TPA: hypothetical protein VF598_11700 [Hymenobacter sp.]|jgi:hypothetical protein
MENPSTLSPHELQYANLIYERAKLIMELAYEPNFVRLQMLEDDQRELNEFIANEYCRLMGVKREQALPDFTLSPPKN